ncbi:hypothetical protein MTO96_002991 [Rhipicephalus appendiculatus]
MNAHTAMRKTALSVHTVPHTRLSSRAATASWASCSGLMGGSWLAAISCASSCVEVTPQMQNSAFLKPLSSARVNVERE